MLFDKTEIICYPFRIGGKEARVAARRKMERRTSANARLRRFAHNLRRAIDILYFFAHNPLKSPDSDE
jgi:hypothetical protein